MGVCLLAIASRPALRPTHLPLQWIPAVPYRRVKRPVREANHLPPSSAEVKNARSYISPHQYIFVALCLIKEFIRLNVMILRHRNKLTFYL
jgi:hypothetical protein